MIFSPHGYPPTDAPLANWSGNEANAIEAFLQALGDTSQLSQASLSSRYLPATVLGASNGNDDTTTIQTALTATATTGGVVRGLPGQTYKITAPLVISSNTTLDMTGCTVSSIGNAGRMLRNTALGGSGARDANIQVIGGSWVRDTTNADTQMIAFHRCDGFIVQNASFTAAGGKDCVYVTDCTDFKVTMLTLSTTSGGGVQVIGPSSNFEISNIFGTAVDDLVAITARDYSQYELTAGGGLIANGDVRDVFVVNAFQAVKVQGGSTGSCRNIVVSNIFGSTSQHFIALMEDTNQANTTGNDIDGITIRNISGTCGSGYNLVSLSGSGMKGILVDGVRAAPSAALNVVNIISGGSSTTRLTVRNVVIDATGTVNVTGVNVASGQTVGAILLDGVWANLDTTTANGRIASIAGPINSCRIRNVTQIGGEHFLYFSSASAQTIYLDDIDVSSSAYAVANNAPSVLTAYCGKLTAASITNLFWSTTGAAGCGTTIIGGPFNGVTQFRSGTLPLRVNAPTMAVDVGKLNAAVAGDMANNNNAAVAPFATGVSIYDGTRWKLVSTGATKTGTATLVAGTVTVSDASITANSIIRVANKTAGGTVGAPYVSARVASTSFTITSTNGADTSVIQYDVLAY